MNGVVCAKRNMITQYSVIYMRDARARFEEILKLQFCGK